MLQHGTNIPTVPHVTLKICNIKDSDISVLISFQALQTGALRDLLA